MEVIGLTGPSGAGKSEASRLFAMRGFKIIDADAVYHDILIPPSDCLDELVRTFGQGILTENKLLDRKALAAIVFGEGNGDKLELLNKITHKYVLSRIRGILDSLRGTDCSACIIDAPLLLESGLDKDCDLVISVIADKALRAERIAQRDHISADSVYLRLNSQKDDAFYARNSDYCIENNGDLKTLTENIDNILSARGY